MFNSGIHATVAGIGFTMSIFISTLASEDVPTQNIAKLSVLVASFSAIILGYCWIRFEKKSFTKITDH